MSVPLLTCDGCEGRGRVCAGHSMADPFSQPETCSDRECSREDECDECRGTGRVTCGQMVIGFGYCLKPAALRDPEGAEVFCEDCARRVVEDIRREGFTGRKLEEYLAPFAAVIEPLPLVETSRSGGE
jgi:hypothetical protein